VTLKTQDLCSTFPGCAVAAALRCFLVQQTVEIPALLTSHIDMTLGKQQHDLFHTITFYCIHCYISAKQGDKIPAELFSFFDGTSLLQFVWVM